jgi:hypothetical protein
MMDADLAIAKNCITQLLNTFKGIREADAILRVIDDYEGRVEVSKKEYDRLIEENKQLIKDNQFLIDTNATVLKEGNDKIAELLESFTKLDMELKDKHNKSVKGYETIIENLKHEREDAEAALANKQTEYNNLFITKNAEIENLDKRIKALKGEAATLAR